MTGCDLIPPRLVQQSAEVLSQQFSALFNYVLDHTTVPSQWKLGEISPVHKKDCNLMKSNKALVDCASIIFGIIGAKKHNFLNEHCHGIISKF